MPECRKFLAKGGFVGRKTFINSEALIVSEDYMAIKGQSEASLVSVIREMVKAGESEENILNSLQQLGVSQRDAKKLLLLGEADTFALLQNEINKMVKEYFEKEKPALVGYIKEKVGETEDEMVDRVENRALNAFKEDQRFIENQATMSQARINQSVKNILDLNDETKRNLRDLGVRVSDSERDLWALKERVFGTKTVRAMSTILLALEACLAIGTLILLLTGTLQPAFGSILAASILGITAAILVFVIRMRA